MGEKLYFNGVNGDTGEYWDGPETVEEFYDHIAGRNPLEDRQRKNVEKTLRYINRVDKIQNIVRLLAESNEEDVARDETWQQKWLAKLASLLAKELLGETYTSSGQIEALQTRLHHHTVDKLVKLVELLADNRTQPEELAKFLLDDPYQEPDNTVALKAKLKQDFEDKLIELKNKLFSEEVAAKVRVNQEARLPWIEQLLSKLKQLPINALRVLGKTQADLVKESNLTYVISTPLQELEERLTDSQQAPLIALANTLETITAGDWNQLLEILERELKAIQNESESVWQFLIQALDKWREKIRQLVAGLNVIEGVDATDLKQAGWGIIFMAEDSDQPFSQAAQIQEALAPLLDLREQQAGTLFQIYDGKQGYLFGETAADFIARVSDGRADVTKPVDPEVVPYYLLIVGNPIEIPYHFQYQLDVQYAVGRIYFDTLEDYAYYARNVVAAEKQPLAPSAKAAFFGTAHDRPTASSAKYLITPLVKRLHKKSKSEEKEFTADWTFTYYLKDDATKPNLLKLIGGEDKPNLLFTATHGLEFDANDPDKQMKRQGALLCQWEPGRSGEISTDYYVCAEDLLDNDEADLSGMIAFFFACYGAGTPRYDAYARKASHKIRKVIAEDPFVAALPTAMLTRPKGGALAVVGHLERAWATSFLEGDVAQVQVFQSTIERLLKGQPLGWAMEYFNSNYAALATELTAALDMMPEPSPQQVTRLWTANNDARGYIVIGDPAVRLPIAKTQEKIQKRTAQGPADDDWF